MTDGKKKVDTEEAKRLALEGWGDLFDNYSLPTAKVLQDALRREGTSIHGQHYKSKRAVWWEERGHPSSSSWTGTQKIQIKWKMDLFDLFSALKMKAEEFLKNLQQQR